jgi:thiosulfate/3-mercaptopyruvate sulfurtransferase
MKYPIVVIVIYILLSGFSGNERKSCPAQEAGLMRQTTGSNSTPSEIKQNKNQEPWTSGQLMNPADLASVISDPKARKPLIFCVGPGALILGSLDMGPAKEKENLEKFKLQLSKLPKDANIVIYCGCCPFEHCPNIRPAFSLLKEMKFTNAHLLNLEHNIKTDWVAKGYPQA